MARPTAVTLLYPMLTIPCLLKQRFTRFIWRGKRPRIALTKLYMPKTKGGLNFPNVKVYNLACFLRDALDWLSGEAHYSNTALEQVVVRP